MTNASATDSAVDALRGCVSCRYGFARFGPERQLPEKGFTVARARDR